MTVKRRHLILQVTVVTNLTTVRLPSYVFHNIEPTPLQTNSTELLMKRPEIKARGNVIFESLYRGQDGFDVSKGIEGIEGIPLELIGANVDVNLGYVDSYDISSKNKHATNYLTYISNLQFIQPSKNIVDKTELRIPGDISEQAKQEGIHVPWKVALVSNTNIILVTVLSIAVSLTLFLTWQKSIRGSGNIERV